ncbi:MAG: hypothetical protein RQM90_09150 [Methanoculleus sp.]
MNKVEPLKIEFAVFLWAGGDGRSVSGDARGGTSQMSGSVR